MICPSCYGPSRIARTLDTGTEVTRIHECLSVDCDSVWTTDQKLRAGSLRRNRRAIRRHGQATNGISDGTAPPSAVANPSASTNGAGGVGGALSSGSDLGLQTGSGPSLGSDPGESRARSLAPYVAPRRLAQVGAVSLAFLRCYERYPNTFRKLQAAQTWQELAETFPGGENALADAICAAFDAGMLKRKPYNGNAVPKFETVLAERLWEEAASAVVPEAAAPENFAQRDARLAREAGERTRRAIGRDVAHTAATLTTCPVHLYGPREDRKCNARCPMWEGTPPPVSPARALAESKGLSHA